MAAEMMSDGLGGLAMCQLNTEIDWRSGAGVVLDREPGAGLDVDRLRISLGNR